MVLPLSKLQLDHKIGPRKPMPFPGSGKHVKLISCPKCRLKGVPTWYAPYELGYETKCFKCGARHAIKSKDITFSEIQNKGGFTPRHHKVKERQDGTLDATGAYDEFRQIKDQGYKKAYRSGIVVRYADEM